MPRILAICFVISMFVPVEFFTMLGSVRLEAYRLVLAIALLYALININRVLEQANLADILLVILIVLVFASFWYNHGPQKAIESTGIYAIETLGAFYLARLYITTPLCFYQIHQWFIVPLVLLTLPTIYEALSHHRILHDIAKTITGHEGLDPRLYTADYMRAGLLRATSLFEHPILYGTLMAMFFPFTIMLWWRYRQFRQVLSTTGLAISMVLTFSSAPLLAIIFQTGTAVLARFWYGAKQFWIAFFTGSLALAFLIETFSNRGFFGILISYLTFNPNTGYFRLLQWQFTADDIRQHIMLGIGHHDWTRPYWMEWMGNSIDSFWLLLILQHGLFALLLLLIACFYTAFSTLNLVHRHHEQTRWMVMAWIMSFMSLIFIGFTVDYFGKLQPAFFFMLGAINWAKFYPVWNTQAASPITNDLDNHTSVNLNNNRLSHSL